MKTVFIILISILLLGCEDTTDLQSQLAQAHLDYKQKLNLIESNEQRASILTEENNKLKKCLDEEADLSANHFVYDEQDIQIKKNTVCYEAGIIRVDKILDKQKKK